MVTGKETNKVYLSKKLSSDERFTKTCNALTKILEKHAIKCDFLDATKDIWCRDYMPIQINKGKFVQFRYEPSYLKDYPELQSDSKEVCKAKDINPKFSKINLDGGNVVNWSDRAIISDRVFDENPEYSNKNKLIAEIEELLEVEIIVIPQIKSDMTGHADGMVRFVERNKVLGNDRKQEFKYWKNGINKVLKEKGIEYIDIPFLDHKEKKYPVHAIGCYVNYLEVLDLIVLPIFETVKNKDQEVYDKFKEIFPDKKIETINFNEIGLHGGLLNCTTWTIKD
jgi:agmatine deiminase